ncbi:copper chaperone PCu(A)C [uncultured Psychrosphaera sp.]|uniref:copper chaperone PCu(A)C n=1 Tax=uncultured Psychrosphaera sp. TaxID=1403522 RepID=UPI00260DB6E7|nr:copper chaperone PCu(A)C [uncultured Psychrosphaera sp.]
MNKISTLLVMIVGLYCQNASALDIEVKNGVVRSPIPGMANTVGYMELTNKGSDNIVLISAKSDLSKKVEVHDHIMNDGVMKMVKLDGLTINTNETKTFQSGGLHLMFIGLNEQDAMKKTIDVTFIFQDGSEQVATFDVKSIHQHHH